jgi:MoaA/NifB/PqqE/SkfB family radical SAM enzyme
VVIWNLIRRCNLTCKHCYAFSADHDYPGELSTQQVFGVMDDLKAFKVPALILSGGEPLLRPDIFEMAERAKAMKFYVGLSTNGTLIDEPLAERIHATGFDYVGISLDGIGATHDKFRRLDGAFDRSLGAVRHLQKLGTKVGLRFTMTELNAFDLPKLLQLMRDEGVDKFYFSHLNYAGRGNIHRGKDAHHLATRQRAGPAVRHRLGRRAGRRPARVRHRQQRRRRRVPAAVGAAAPAALDTTRAPAPCRLGRQQLGRQRGQHRQPGRRAPRHHVVALHAWAT